MTIPDAMDIILKNLHSYHVELTSTVLEIACYIFRSTEEGYDWVLAGLHKINE